jgi:hypothetical protein
LIESVLLCVVLLIPLAWGIALLDKVHRAALASTAAARDAGFEAVHSQGLSMPTTAMDRAVDQAFTDQDLDPGIASFHVSAPGLLQRGARIEIQVRYEVRVFGSWLPFAAVPIRAVHAAHVPSFGSRDA